MTLRHLLLGGTTALFVAMTAVPGPTGLPFFVSSAEAATEARVSVSTFYDRLASDGDWVQYKGTAVFVPTKVADGWRPYTVGHWASTKKYGWLWVSEEPFGWATYHYGRWGYADEIGWYWVPGTRWAPAWVSWRHDKGHVVWAPLPPRRGSDDLVSIEVSYDETPDYYWVAVPTRDFLEEDLSTVVVRDDRERVRIIEEAQPVGEVRVQNNIVINNFIEVGVIQRETGRQVTTVDVREARSPDQAGTLKGNTITIFDADVTAAADAKPAKLKDISEVSQVQTNRKLKPTEKAVEPTAGQAVTPKADGTPAPADTATGADKLKPKDQPAATEQAVQPEPATPKAKTKDQPAATEQAVQPEPATPKAKMKDQPAATDQAAQPEPTTPKAKAKDQPAATEQAVQPEPATSPKKAKPKDQPAAADAVTQPEPTTPKKAKPKAQPAAADEGMQPEPATPKKPKPAAADEAMQPEPATPKKAKPADAVGMQPQPAAPRQPKVIDQPEAKPQKQVQPEQGGEPAKPKKAPGKGCDPAAGAEC